MFSKLYILSDKANVVLTGPPAGMEEDLPLLSQVKEWQEIYRLLSERMRDKSLSSGHNHTATTRRWCQLAKNKTKQTQTNPKTRLVSSLCRIECSQALVALDSDIRDVRLMCSIGGRRRTEALLCFRSQIIYHCSRTTEVLEVVTLRAWFWLTLDDFLFYPCHWSSLFGHCWPRTVCMQAVTSFH